MILEKEQAWYYVYYHQQRHHHQSQGLSHHSLLLCQLSALEYATNMATHYLTTNIVHHSTIGTTRGTRRHQTWVWYCVLQGAPSHSLPSSRSVHRSPHLFPGTSLHVSFYPSYLPLSMSHSPFPISRRISSIHTSQLSPHSTLIVSPYPSPTLPTPRFFHRGPYTSSLPWHLSICLLSSN